MAHPLPVLDAAPARQASPADPALRKVQAPEAPWDGRHDLAWLRRKVGYAAWSVGALLSGAVPSECYYYFGGIGDDLLCTAVFRELRRRGHGPARMMSDRKAVFENNPDVGELIRSDPRVIALARRLGRRVVSLDYALDYERDQDRHPVPPFPLIARMCALAGIQGEVSLRPYLFLTDEERRFGEFARGRVAIVSSGLSARHTMLNKQWGPERFQAVVDALGGRFDFLQVGDRDDPPLVGALDLRGRTTLRETAAVLSHSRLLVGHVGLLMHLARAVDCRSVIVFGGREAPRQSGYRGNENLYTPLPCAPCWQYNACDYGRECLARITPALVADAVVRQAERWGEPMEAETFVVVPPERAA